MSITYKIVKDFNACLLRGLLASFFIAFAPAAEALNLPDIPKACLPTPDRMLPDRSQPCHCPPEALCGTGELPPFIESICCASSGECDASIIFHSGTICPGEFTTGPEPVIYCMRYQGTPDEGTPKVVAEELNTCLLTRCEPHLQAALASDSPPTFTGQRVYSSASYDYFKEFAVCELSCRQTAAAALSSSANTALHDLLVNWQDASLPRSPSLAMPYRLKNFLEHVFVQWRESTNARMGRVQEFLDGNPPPPIPVDDFGGQLTCVDTKISNICYVGLLNDNTCNSCLAPQTQVLMADGMRKPIETITAGDKVKTAYGKTAAVEEVVVKEWPELQLYAINHGTLRLTADHPVMTTLGWRAVDYNTAIELSNKRYGLQNVPKLKEGDVLVTADGEITVESILAEEVRKNAKTYNLRLNGGDSFYANGVLVKDN